MTEPSVDERPAGETREHPPFRLRERRRLLLPDLTPPTLEELRWASRQRRLHREQLLPAPRPMASAESIEEPELPAQSVGPDAIAAPEVAVPVDVNVATEIEAPVQAVIELPQIEPVEREIESEVAPIVDESAFDIPELDTTELSLPEHEHPEPPLVAHALVVREPAPVEPGRIAVLDEVAAEAPAIVTRIVPLPAAVLHEVVVDEPLAEPDYAEDTDEAAAEAAVPTEVDGRPAPLYWRLLRLRYTRPNGWLRALFFEGSVAVAVVLVLAEAASVWTIVVLPFVVAVVVKANDVLAGNLRQSYRPTRR